MTQIFKKAEHQISELLNNIYRTLSKYPQVSDEQRELLPAQQELMSVLQQDHFLYQSLLRVLAIDSYATSISSNVYLYEQFSGLLTIVLQGINQLGLDMRSGNQKKKIMDKFNKVSSTLVQVVKVSQKIMGISSYTDDQNSLIQSLSLEYQIEESLITKLTLQNQELYVKAETNQKQILSLEAKLTKLLKQHQGCERGQFVGGAMSSMDLREELCFKEAEIQRMNEEFGFEIEKYNTVFQALKREIEQFKTYQNVDLIQQIELLETEIVRLREQRERDQIIIRQLRSDNTMFASTGYYSPRQSGNFRNSRIGYP